MTAQTAAQRNQSYRARRKAKLERLVVLERALREIAMLSDDRARSPAGRWFVAEEIARKALGDVG